MHKKSIHCYLVRQQINEQSAADLDALVDHWRTALEDLSELVQQNLQS
jgi:hypothetical protein